MSCYDNGGKSFIPGRQYLAICRRYDKKISGIQSQWGKIQAAHGEKYPKPSGHVLKLYKKKRDTIHNYLHKTTRYVVRYCKKNEIHTAVIGDITGIREDKDPGHVNNQKLHSLPYRSIYSMLEYRLTLEGIRLIMQEESYTSQCSPKAKTVGKQTAKKLSVSVVDSAKRMETAVMLIWSVLIIFFVNIRGKQTGNQNCL